MYELTVIDMFVRTYGLRGSDVSYRKFFTTLPFAKQYARKSFVGHFKGSKEKPQKIEWKGDPKDCVTSQDLGFIRYQIVEVELVK